MSTPSILSNALHFRGYIGEELTDMLVTFQRAPSATLTAEERLCVQDLRRDGYAVVPNYWTREHALELRDTDRLSYVALGVTAVGFVSIFYSYPPAATDIEPLGHLFRQSASLLLTTSEARGPYEVVAGGWVSLPHYFLFSVGNYLLVVCSAIVWLVQGLSWLRGTGRPRAAYFLMWLLYAAFALQGAFSILADRTGLLGGNLEHRSFPSFALMATPLLGSALSTWRIPLRVKWVAAAACSVLRLLAILKTTNEPLVTNYWNFHIPTEVTAMKWVSQNAPGAPAWVGYDARLKIAYAAEAGSHPTAWVSGSAPAGAPRLFLMSDILWLQSTRTNAPILAGELEPYLRQRSSAVVPSSPGDAVPKVEGLLIRLPRQCCYMLTRFFIQPPAKK